ncbi:hypothetical protein [Actinomyces sp.]|uniref:hypothetical protein n=1 Tax=Actinomyces sp. TaxID=29317 RepID=UPI0026DDCB9D|nr:hypothetical protein [Actinomyces sp.]MDO4900819.1 hypothetical protein [Actinomyces sp.]
MADRFTGVGASSRGARTANPPAAQCGADDGAYAPAPDAYADSLLVRVSSVVYQAAALAIGATPLIAPAAVGMLLLDGASAWSLLVLTLVWALALTALPAVVYAVTRPGWTFDPSARYRISALWRGWRGAVAQFGPIAVLAVALTVGLAGSTAGLGGGPRAAVLTLLAVVGLGVGRVGAIIALFSFRSADLFVLTAVMTIRDAVGTLFLAGIGAAGMLIALHAPAVLMLAWVPLCALVAPATRGQRRTLTEQFTRPAAPTSTEA